MSWRYECPHGHVTLSHRLHPHDPERDPHFYCQSCDNQGRDPQYSFKIDKKTNSKISAKTLS